MLYINHGLRWGGIGFAVLRHLDDVSGSTYTIQKYNSYCIVQEAEIRMHTICLTDPYCQDKPHVLQTICVPLASVQLV